MIVEIKNDSACAQIDTMGAELKSFMDVLGTEYIWPGDAVHWSGSAPVLFPIVGGLDGGKTRIGGREYRMPRHGITRRSEFRLLYQEKSMAAFSLQSTPETLAQYPFPFSLRVTYSLEGIRLVTTFEVSNMGETEMPFVLGGHPAFRCPLSPGEKFEDYRVEFDTSFTAVCPVLRDDGVIDCRNTHVLFENTNGFFLDHSLFDNDALIFLDLPARKARVKHRFTRRGVEMSFDSFPFLGVWSPPKKQAPFVCLEPWLGVADCTDEDGEFVRKRGMVLLPPMQKQAFSYSFLPI